MIVTAATVSHVSPPRSGKKAPSAGKIGEKRRFIGHLPLESTRSSHPRLDDPPAQSATLSYRYEAGRH
ncbi:hypothetical protein EDWATA_00196 [Edwardsiella tarda ATCC 23685]|uniref:Uncharacterized protein n=1 Tax=Edwardsiella tarda ATCC 23685 TaxID=500638 RepID=D4F0H2_EDWTA|nr:hypothetical protein EDWATA_00196 [Edwardsiella tarda ATCC 23685]